jgi:hypothetical protein
VPHPNDDDRVAFEVDAVANDIRAAAERNNKLAVTGRPRSGSSRNEWIAPNSASTAR